jgi:hypothetical protein
VVGTDNSYFRVLAAVKPDSSCVSLDVTDMHFLLVA